MSNVVLISTAEFVLKSQPVRQQLVRLLKRHIRFNLRRIGQENYTIRSAGGFLVIEGLANAETMAQSLVRILGVSHADACERTSTNLSELVGCLAKIAERTIGRGETFAVRARRFEPSQLKGKEIEIRGGSEILSRLSSGVGVNLDTPDHTLGVFYGAKDAYVSAIRFDGPRGLPVGSQGSLLGLATDPAYAPLSFYLLMKRGAMVWPIIADLPPTTGVFSPEHILQGLRRLRPYIPKNRCSAKLVTLADSTRRELASVPPDLQRVFCMRVLFRAVRHLARNTLGLVTGDRLGQHGVESMKDLKVIDGIATFPVYRPLLTIDEAYTRRQLEELGLTQIEPKKAATQAPSSAWEGLMDEVRLLEDRLQADQLARSLAADSRKIQIDFP